MGSKKLIQDLQQIEAILAKAKFIRLALSDPETSNPYLVPLSFGYKDNAIYLHGSQKGRKIEILKKNSRVCFEAAIETELITADDPAIITSDTGALLDTGRHILLRIMIRKLKGLPYFPSITGRRGLLSLKHGRLTGCV